MPAGRARPFMGLLGDMRLNVFNPLFFEFEYGDFVYRLELIDLLVDWIRDEVYSGVSFAVLRWASADDPLLFEPSFLLVSCGVSLSLGFKIDEVLGRPMEL